MQQTSAKKKDDALLADPCQMPQKENRLQNLRLHVKMDKGEYSL
jgi:hypothetical protein